MKWVNVRESLPELNELVVLINIDRLQNDIAGDYPVANVGHLSYFGGHYWSCYGARAIMLDSFTHWCSLPVMPKEFTDKYLIEEDQCGGKMKPLDEEQKEEIQHIVLNGLNPISNYINILRDHEGQRENLIEYMDRCEKSVELLLIRLKELGI